MAKNETNSNQPSALDQVKKSLGKAADLAGLKLQLHKVEKKREETYSKLGELYYVKSRPRDGEVPAEIETAMENALNEITALNHEISELKLRVELMKAK